MILFPTTALAPEVYTEARDLPGFSSIEYRLAAVGTQHLLHSPDLTDPEKVPEWWCLICT